MTGRREKRGAVQAGDGRERKVDRKDRKETRRVCREHVGLQRKVLVDRRAVDYPEREKRFEVIYVRRSVRYSMRRTVKAEVGEREEVETVTDRFHSANWMERERWDRMGVGVKGHLDRRRILTDYGTEGHPLRKDYPLTGYVERQYDEAKKRVVSEERERSQANRKQ